MGLQVCSRAVRIKIFNRNSLFVSGLVGGGGRGFYNSNAAGG